MIEKPAYPFSFARKHKVLAQKDSKGILQVSFCQETSIDAFLESERIFGQGICYQQISTDALEDAISLAYQGTDNALASISDIDEVIDLNTLAESIPESEDLLDAQDDAPVIRLINALFSEAIRQQASDIHLETFEQSMSVRLRVDGMLKEIIQPSRPLAPLLISRIKVMAKLDIAEKRLPQDGRVSLKMAGKSLDVRISTMPALHGERVVMRLLDRGASKLDLVQLGMPGDILTQFRQLLEQPNGIILVTGPTGSGKTTSLYAGLSQINNKNRNILTVEDPVEYALEGIGQTPVNSKSGMTFEKGLRAILRQDPDVVMVGEIRDPQTAQIAVQASLTGHLVLSTLHTNDAIGAIIRLMDIGIEPYLIASSLKAVMAQRLLRTLCKDCAVDYELQVEDAQALGDLSLTGVKVKESNGCNKCLHTGYSGRQGVFELLVVDKGLSRLIHDCSGEHEMSSYLTDKHFSMLEQGRQIVLSGLTSPSELLRMVKESSGYVIL